MVLGGGSCSAPTVVIIFDFISYHIFYVANSMRPDTSSSRTNRKARSPIIHIATAVELKQQKTVAR